MFDKQKLGISYNFEFKFNKKLINQFDHLINIHHSLLSMKKGLMPIYNALKNNQEFATFMHLINNKLDEGQIIFQ